MSFYHYHRWMLASLFVVIPIVTTQAFNENNARSLVGSFYSNLTIIAGEKFDADGSPKEAAVLAKYNSIELCSTENISLPNEFHQFGFEGNDRFLGALTYLGRLQNFANAYDVVFKANILAVEAQEEIKAAKNENATNFYNVYVKKSIAANGKTKSYTDTVLVYAQKGKIQNIHNITGGGFRSGGQESVLNMRGEAARLFASKKYNEAFKMYLQIVKKSPTEGDAYYRLGLMAYHNKGCKEVFKNGRERRTKALEYMEKAEKYGNDEIKTYAKRVLYYMKNGSV